VRTAVGGDAPKVFGGLTRVIAELDALLAARARPCTSPDLNRPARPMRLQGYA